MDNNTLLAQTIIDLSAEEAMRFFMKQESFCNVKLPKYFNFQELLDGINEKIDNKSVELKKIYDGTLNKLSDINYKFFQNKDGLYSWRPLQIIHPVIYIFLVREITKKNNWKFIVDRFKEFQANKSIVCYSLPKINLSKHTDTADTVLKWWNDIEQQAIKLSMDYKYLMNTDITDCYGSIYTHSITWAMCGMEIVKKKILQGEKFKLSAIDGIRYHIGDNIDKLIRAMSYQQTNGIPQGSVLMDFVAEMVLGYADLELSDKLSSNDYKELKDYKIFRYRDDYRIYANTQEDVIKVAKALTEVLSTLNFKLNTQKTNMTQNLICGAIKPDKLYYITKDYKRLEEPDTHYTLQKHLLRINHLAQKHPNSGSLQKAMDIFFKRLCNIKELDLFKETESTDVLISIVTNIAFNNPKVYMQFVAIVGKILSYEADKKKKEEILNKILTKFHQLPNVGYLEIWLQRLTIKEDRTKLYSEAICQLATGGKSIWNIEWLKQDEQNLFNTYSVVDEGSICDLTDSIEYDEFEDYSRY